MKRIGNKIYDVCSNCAKVVCLNKPFFGSVHVCTTTEERNEHSLVIEAKVRQMKKEFNKI